MCVTRRETLNERPIRFYGNNGLYRYLILVFYSLLSTFCLVFFTSFFQSTNNKQGNVVYHQTYLLSWNWLIPACILWWQLTSSKQKTFCVIALIRRERSLHNLFNQLQTISSFRDSVRPESRLYIETLIMARLRSQSRELEATPLQELDFPIISIFSVLLERNLCTLFISEEPSSKQNNKIVLWCT